MKAIKNIKKVNIGLFLGDYFIVILNIKGYGLECGAFNKNFKTRKGAEGYWERFAKLNGIKNCKIMGLK